MTHSSISDFYWRQVLPALFERLDRAFPEFDWTSTEAGWYGVRRSVPGGVRSRGEERIVCNHPWGYVTERGTSSSWLTYANDGRPATGTEFVHTVKKLARLAGIEHAWMEPRGVSREDHARAQRRERRQELLEAFIGYCHVSYQGGGGAGYRQSLQETYGIDKGQVAALPVGVCPPVDEVAKYLHDMGFSRDEILASCVASDVRIAGRLVVAWRDRWGRIKTIVARALHEKHESRAPYLYLKGGTKSETFGLNGALRSGSGGEGHLILVDRILDAIVLQALGMTNVAALGVGSPGISRHVWESLHRHQVKTVTLMLDDNDAGWSRVEAAIREANRAECSPSVFTLAPGDFGGAQTVCDFLRTRGLAALEHILSQRIHGFRHMAKMFVRPHRAQGSDSDRMDLLNRAVDFDHEVHDPQRGLELNQFFWPTILECLGADWEDVRWWLRDRFEVGPGAESEGWHVRNLKKLMRDLRVTLNAGDLGSFRALIRAAARDVQWDAPEPVDVFPHRRDARPSPPPYVDNSRTKEDRPPATSHVDVGATGWRSVYAPEWRRLGYAVRFREPSDAEIRALAYELWDQSGRPRDKDQYFWYEAKRRLTSFETHSFPFSHSTYAGIDRAAA